MAVYFQNILFKTLIIDMAAANLKNLVSSEWNMSLLVTEIVEVPLKDAK